MISLIQPFGDTIWEGQGGFRVNRRLFCRRMGRMDGAKVREASMSAVAISD